MGQQESAHILVAGAGLAGLATAVWLAEAGHRVTLVEKRGRLGGRTISFEVSGIEGRVDNGQHLFAGCYDALLRYVDTIGTRDKLFWDAPPFAIKTGPGELLTLRAPSWLPSALRRAVGLSWMVWPPIPLRERPAALRTWARILRASRRPTPELDGLTVDRWFKQIGAPESLRALVLDQFVIGLLNEKTERVSASMFVQTLHWIGNRALAGNTRAGDAVWPRVSLHELFVAPAERYLKERGGEVLVGSGVGDIEITDDGLTGVRLSDGRVIEVDAAVLALPPWSLTTLLDRGRLGQYDHFTPARKIEPAPISSVYVWLDRPLRMRRLAENLRDTTIEWVFDTTGMHGEKTEAGHCYSLAVSASWDVVHLPNAEFTAAALESLAKHYPEVAEAEVLRTHVIHQPQATFSAQPGFDDLRLPQRTPIEGLFLAGDWTDTGMPSTMEAAVESAVRAVDAVREYLRARVPTRTAD
ncbi:hydroxysqualene dehydroxylase HpnE [Nocardia takedensis]